MIAVATVAMVAAVTAALIAASTLSLAGLDRRPGPVDQPKPTLNSVPVTNGWVAVNDDQADGVTSLLKPGEDPRELEVAGSAAADEACPVWSPD